MWIKNADGKPSASLTLAIVAFVLTASWFLLSFLNVKLGTWSVREFEETAALSFLLPCLSLYWGRRASEVKTVLEAAKKKDEA